MKKYKTIDLFCGAGGFSKGFEMSGEFQIIKGYDIDKEALKTFNYNHKAEGIEYDITNSVPEELKKADIDVVIGSPPCQGFSDAKGSRNVGDERNNLVFKFIDWIKEIEPKVIVMENVTGLLTISDSFIKKVKDKYKKAGYKNVVYSILNSKNFGVPQNRRRAVFIATRNDIPISCNINFDDIGDNLGINFYSHVNVEDAISDLPCPTKDGIADYNCEAKNKFQEVMRLDSQKVYNHIAKTPREKDMFIVEKIPEGKMYRSTRFGQKYIGVWDLFKDNFNLKERLILWFIARYRGRKYYKVTDKSGPDYISGKKIIESLNDESVLKEACEYGFEYMLIDKLDIKSDDLINLEKDGWIRKKEVKNIVAYDLNSKSGIRPRYIRLSRTSQSNTILTTDFNAREKLHPFENRGLSLREGARIQSFPDDFIFQGDFDSIARQIGNAVPPLMSKGIAEYILNFLENKKEKAV